MGYLERFAVLASQPHQEAEKLQAGRNPPVLPATGGAPGKQMPPKLFRRRLGMIARCQRVVSRKGLTSHSTNPAGEVGLGR